MDRNARASLQLTLCVFVAIAIAVAVAVAVATAAKCKKLKRSQLGLCLAGMGSYGMVGRGPGQVGSELRVWQAGERCHNDPQFIYCILLPISLCCQGEASTQGGSHKLCKSSIA